MIIKAVFHYCFPLSTNSNKNKKDSLPACVADHSHCSPLLCRLWGKKDTVGEVWNEYEMPVEHSNESTNHQFYKQILKFNKVIWVRISIFFY